MFVRLADFAAEELHDAEHLAAKEHREPEGAVQAFPRRNGCRREVGVCHDVGDPRSSGVRPYATWQADAAPERHALTNGTELSKSRFGRAPDPGTTKAIALTVDRPQSTMLPAERLADRFQNPEFYKAQAMRLPIYEKPRVIGCAEEHRSTAAAEWKSISCAPIRGSSSRSTARSISMIRLRIGAIDAKTSSCRRTAISCCV